MKIEIQKLYSQRTKESSSPSLTHMDQVFVLYYNSESAYEDDITSAHGTLESAIEEARRLTKEIFYDIDPEELDLTLKEKSSPTKGVNKKGWNVGCYNIYTLPFKK